ncbi:MAG: phosphate signaling complex protein PhoU [Phycisphaeraceae bacterium]|nr:phosphate signaling complex protein PhoU [Phycisphaeraceae bacterium]
MSIHLRRQEDKIRKLILNLGGLVEQAVRDAVASMEDRNADLARKVIDNDDRIDACRLDLEEEILATLALHQPVAFDLRYVISILKMGNDLERIGDLAVNIAEQAVFLAGEEEVRNPPFDVPAMAVAAQHMLKQALDALVRVDTQIAEAVCQADDQVDAEYRGIFDKVHVYLQRYPQHLDQMLHLINIARQCERISDHAVNMAEDVLYLAKGEFQKA